jgi:hypothetical protein
MDDPFAKWRTQPPVMQEQAGGDPFSKWRTTAPTPAPQEDWRTREAQENLFAMQPRDPGDTEIRGNILPFSRDVETNKVSLAVPGMLYDPATLPGDVYTGKVDPKTAPGRTLGFAALATPMARGALPKAATPPSPAAKVAANREYPTTNDIKGMSQGFYKEAEDAGVRFTGEGFGRMVAELTPAVKKAGIDPKLTPDSWSAMQRLIREIPRDVKPDAMSPVTGVVPKPSSKTLSWEDMDTLRKVVGVARKSKNDADRRIGSIIADRIDEWMGAPKPKDIASGDPLRAANAAKAARGLWTRAKKAELLDRAQENALDAVGANYSNAGMQTALRQQFRAIRKSRDFNKFDPQEQALIKSIIRGASLENSLRWLGKFAPTSPLAAVISLSVGHTAGGPVGAGALMGAGALAARKSASMGAKKVDKLNALVRRGYDEEGALY